MSWYRLDLKGGLHEVTDRAWREVWKAAYEDGPFDATNGLFRVARSGAFTLYFSPAARELAGTFGARKCKKPTAEKLVFVAGPSEARELHFPRSHVSRPAELIPGPDIQALFLSTQPFSAFPSTQAA